MCARAVIAARHFDAPAVSLPCERLGSGHKGAPNSSVLVIGPHRKRRETREVSRCVEHWKDMKTGDPDDASDRVKGEENRICGVPGYGGELLKHEGGGCTIAQ